MHFLYFKRIYLYLVYPTADNSDIFAVDDGIIVLVDNSVRIKNLLIVFFSPFWNNRNPVFFSQGIDNFFFCSYSIGCYYEVPRTIVKSNRIAQSDIMAIKNEQPMADAIYCFNEPSFNYFHDTTS